MCTLTVQRTPASFSVTMNRDESRQRGPERPPALHRLDAPQSSWIAPSDSESGGTWIGVNSHGVTACILNRYLKHDEEVSASGGPSRGILIPTLLPMGRANQVTEYIENQFDPTPFASFDLIIAHTGGIIRYSWNGSGRLISNVSEDEWYHFASSSWKPDEVIPYREQHFLKWLQAGAPEHSGIPAHHLFRVPGMECYAPLMDRPESHTRSITRIAADPAEESIRLSYWPRESVDAGGPPIILEAARIDEGEQRHP